MATVLPPVQAPQTRTSAPGAHLRLIVLASGPGRCIGIDLDSGAFVRASWPSSDNTGFSTYQLATAVIAEEQWPADPTRPESVELEGPPQAGGRIPGWRVGRYLRPLEAPAGQPLLGFSGSEILYWQVPGTHPSVALIRPVGRIHLRSRQIGALGGQAAATVATATGEAVGTVGDLGRDPEGAVPVAMARFEWGGARHDLPVLDAGGRADSAQGRVPGWTGRAAPRYLLIALTGPVAGYCHKSVLALLPRP
ncbi:MAG: hypothetical protein ACRD0J_16865 [Acidimicrobiales bacterium]